MWNKIFVHDEFAGHEADCDVYSFSFKLSKTFCLLRKSLLLSKTLYFIIAYKKNATVHKKII